MLLVPAAALDAPSMQQQQPLMSMLFCPQHGHAKSRSDFPPLRRPVAPYSAAARFQRDPQQPAARFSLEAPLPPPLGADQICADHEPTRSSGCLAGLTASANIRQDP